MTREELIKQTEAKIASLEIEKTKSEKGFWTYNAHSIAKYEIAISNLYIALAKLYENKI